jgi:membrane protease YdiL (CAAX protease family)
MQPEISPVQLALALLAMLLLSMLFAMLILWGWVFWRLATRRTLLPSQPLVSLSAPTWRGGTVLLAIVLYLSVNFLVTGVYLGAQGRLHATRAGTSKPAVPSVKKNEPANGKQAANPALEKSNQEDTARAFPSKVAEKKTANVIRDPKAPKAPKRPPRDDKEPLLLLPEQMFLLAVINSTLIVATAFLLRMTSGARLHDLGLSSKDWSMQAVVGVVATLIAAPVVYSIQIGAARIWDPNPHALQEMLTQEEFGLGIADLAIISAVILAPIFEEMLFRGVIQRWCIDFVARRFSARKFVDEPVQVGEQSSIVSRLEADSAGNSKPALDEPSVHAAHDSEFADTFNPNSQGESKPVSSESHNRASVILGIVFTSLVFALIHFDQWPAPIALFVLALIIGSIYHRTGSLIAAIFMHATFNGFSTLGLFVAILAGQGKEAKNAVEGRFVAPALVVRMEGGKCGAACPEVDRQKWNSKGFLLDERVLD